MIGDATPDPGDDDADDARRGNPSRLHGAMASGRTPGKRAAEDPSAAPLGTDDEAAGTPPTRAAIEHETARAEQAQGRLGLSADEAMDRRPRGSRESPRNYGKYAAIAAAAVVIALVVWMALL